MIIPMRLCPCLPPFLCELQAANPAVPPRQLAQLYDKGDLHP